MNSPIKRVLDVVLAAVGLLVLSPVLGLIGLAIRLTSPGPAIYRQTRVGRHGCPFTIHKFRTMRVTAVGPSVSAAGDPRITRLGRHLRLWKLDELPQLWDVLVGSMSLVGPRPEVPEFAQFWTSQQRSTILDVRPGITDPATLLMRHEEQVLATAGDASTYYRDVLLPRKAEIYVEYVNTRTLRGDAAIILATLRAIAKKAPRDAR